MSDKFLRNDRDHLLNAIGTEMCWGWSPAVDFATILAGRERKATTSHPKPAESTATTNASAPEQPKEEKPADDESDVDAMIRKLMIKKQTASAAAAPSQQGTTTQDSNDVNILLAGASDIRHILKTLATLRVQGSKQEDPTPVYHFYLYEPNLRTHCRHLFFLQWLLDSMFSLEDLEERVLMFLEAFGNATVRERTAAQIRKVVQRLLQDLEKEKGELMPLVSFTDMKLKEKDFIEGQLQHWCRDGSVADIEEQWSHRLRHDMADRFDNRDNLIDWDFVFKLTDYTNLLKFPEYRVWRNTGNAFDVCHINPRKGFDYVYNTPNKTLCMFNRKGNGVYSGDIKNGPFFAIGSQTGNTFIQHRTTDGTCKYGNGVVAMHNVRAWLFTLMTGQSWPWADHKFAWDDPANYNYLPPGTPSGVEYTTVFPKVKFHFIGLEFDRFLLHAQERHLRMDAAFFGTSCTQFMTPDMLQHVMRPDGVVIAETAKFVVDADDAAKEAFTTRIKDMAKAAGWETDDKVTASLHEGQPATRAYEGSITKQQQVSNTRYALPYQIALRKGSK